MHFIISGLWFPGGGGKIIKMENILLKELERRRKISNTMKEKYRKGIIKHLKEIPHPGPTKSARKKLSDIQKQKWTLGQVTDRQRQTLFKKGHDLKRNQDKIFKEGHEVDSKTREAVKKNRATQVFPLNDTSIEKKMQDSLRQLKIDFITHKRISNIEHAYNCDIFVPSMNLIIECDGDYWHQPYPHGKEIDLIRSREMRERGYRVLRLWGSEINVMELNDLNNILVKMGERR